MVVAIPIVMYAFGRFRLSSTGSDYPISLTVELTKNEYAVGEVINIGFTLTNIGEDPIVVTFPCFPLFDFLVRGIKGEIIYKSSCDLVDFFMIVELELNPGQSTRIL